MTRASLVRTLSMTALAVIIGLISARIPSLSGAEPSFSWAGLFAGVALVVAAFMLSRLFAGSVAKSKPGTPTQRLFLNIALVSFLIALVLLVAILYTPWAWPRILLAVAVVCGALSVFAGLTSIVFGQRGGHA